VPSAAPRAEGERRVLRVERVTDGDTLRLAGLGSSRLVGIDAPERDDAACFDRANQVLRDLLRRSRSRVEVEIAEQPVDRFGRDLVYVWLPDGRFVNEEMVRAGAAVAYPFRDTPRFHTRLARAERQAERRGAGLWGAWRCER
jgi:micrococcal nuclease